MKIKIDHDFNINGKKYNSIDEVPEDLRELVRKAMGPQSSEVPVMTQTKIIFNGKEYNSLEEMPQSARGLYEEVMKAAKSGAIGQKFSVEREGSSFTAGFKSVSGTGTGALRPEPVLSLGKLITGLIATALIGAAVYYLF